MYWLVGVLAFSLLSTPQALAGNCARFGQIHYDNPREVRLEANRKAWQLLAASEIHQGIESTRYRETITVPTGFVMDHVTLGELARITGDRWVLVETLAWNTRKLRVLLRSRGQFASGLDQETIDAFNRTYRPASLRILMISSIVDPMGFNMTFDFPFHLVKVSVDVVTPYGERVTWWKGENQTVVKNPLTGKQEHFLFDKDGVPEVLTEGYRLPRKSQEVRDQEFLILKLREEVGLDPTQLSERSHGWLRGQVSGIKDILRHRIVRTFIEGEGKEARPEMKSEIDPLLNLKNVNDFLEYLREQKSPEEIVRVLEVVSKGVINSKFFASFKEGDSFPYVLNLEGMGWGLKSLRLFFKRPPGSESVEVRAFRSHVGHGGDLRRELKLEFELALPMGYFL